MLVGGVHARYADSISGTAGLTSLRLSGSTLHSAGALTGSLSRFSSGEWVTQVSGFGAAVIPIGSGVSLGGSLGADANHFQGGSWNGQALGGLLAVLSTSTTLATVGASIGTATTVYDSTVGLRVLSASLQRKFGSGTEISGGIVGVSTDTILYADVSLGFTYSRANIRTSLAGGVRTGDLGDDPWGQGQLEYDFLSRLTFELILGRYPQSLIGFTDGLYVTSGIRVRLAGRAPTSGGSERPVEITPLDGNRVRILLKHGGEARSVEIAGVWNGWLPVRLEKEANGYWSAELYLEPGIYQYAIVVDGSNWTVPDGVPSEPDDFGGVVATLVVMER